MAHTLTPDAQVDLDRYLRQLRGVLGAHPRVDVDDVERDVRSHIDAELGNEAGPVSSARLRGVLDRLGEPSQWVPDDDLPLWRRVLVRLRSGPEDWRLAYLTFACLVLAFVLGPVGPAFGIASFILARATLALLDEMDERPGARRWILYPPLVIGYSALALLLLAGPVPLVAAVADPNVTLPVLVRDWVATLPSPSWLGIGLLVTTAAGAWWIVLGGLAIRFRLALQYVFFPFAERLERRHGVRLMLAGLALLLAGGVSLTLLMA